MRLALLLAAAVASFTSALAHRAVRGTFHDFPRINQLGERAAGGPSGDNAQMNCIPASIAAGLEYLTGKKYSGAGVKDAVYGRAYRGPTQIYRYLAWVRSQGVLMQPILSHNPETLVAELRRLLSQGTPVVLSIPSDIDRPPTHLLHPSSVTHVVIAAGFNSSGEIRVMNPWGGVWLDGNDAFWASHICYGELWAMERIQSPQSTSVADVQSAPRQISQPTLRHVPILKLRGTPWSPGLLGANAVVAQEE